MDFSKYGLLVLLLVMLIILLIAQSLTIAPPPLVTISTPVPTFTNTTEVALAGATGAGDGTAAGQAPSLGSSSEQNGAVQTEPSEAVVAESATPEETATPTAASAPSANESLQPDAPGVEESSSLRAELPAGVINLKGSAAAGALLQIVVDDELVGTTTADELGAWSMDVDLASAGEHVITVKRLGALGEAAASPDLSVEQIETPTVEPTATDTETPTPNRTETPRSSRPSDRRP
ncbi:MAG: hypothetical protein HC802_14690, partial [Caldilineaceae bacterium]|nr:hypothetical protein [Caldilineaceae bacterium]